MFSVVVKALALASVALATPATDSKNITTVGAATDVSELSEMLLCTGPFPNNGRGCTQFPIAPGACINFFGAWAVFYKALSGVRVPQGYICKIHRNFFCEDRPADYVLVPPGVFDFTADRVRNGLGNPIWFNEQAASYICNSLN